MANQCNVRYDSGTDEFVLTLDIPGVREFEIRDSMLSRAFLELSEALENEGV